MHYIHAPAINQISALLANVVSSYHKLHALAQVTQDMLGDHMRLVPVCTGPERNSCSVLRYDVK